MRITTGNLTTALVSASVAAGVTVAVMTYDPLPVCDSNLAAMKAFHFSRTGLQPTDQEIMAAGWLPVDCR